MVELDTEALDTLIDTYEDDLNAEVEENERQL